MKRIIASILMLAVLASLLSVSAFAVNKSDLLNEAAKSPVYKYVKVSVENAAKNVEVTDEQAAQLLPIVQKAVAIVDKDNGATVSSGGKRNYTEAQVKGIFECIDQACAILDLHYTFAPSANPKFAGDGEFRVYDANNKMIFDYDGDAVADTAVEESTGSAVVLASGIVLLVAGIGAAYVAKKRYASTAA